MSKGIAVCKQCKQRIDGDFLELCKKVMAGLTCPNCGNQIGKVNNLPQPKKEGESK
ncbi:hypothetical protein FJ208_00935 [Candidatus Gribaldobacteria bacterium]|nr:hypothetical protein [Candidatus Gribaldobacteria bacterium]